VQKYTVELTVFFAHLGALRVKATSKTLMKLTPERVSTYAHQLYLHGQEDSRKPLFFREKRKKYDNG